MRLHGKKNIPLGQQNKQKKLNNNRNIILGIRYTP